MKNYNEPAEVTLALPPDVAVLRSLRRSWTSSLRLKSSYVNDGAVDSIRYVM